MRKFCPKCGKITDNLYENICRDCFLEKLSVMDKLPNEIKLRICKSCGRIVVDKNRFNTIEKAVDKILADFLNKKEIKSASYRINNNKIYVSIKLKIDNVEKSEEKSMNMISRYITCEICSISGSSYYNSTIQLRTKNPDKFLSVIQKKMIELNKNDPFAFISKLDRNKAGYDFYVGSKSSANNIASFFREKYKAKIKISRKLSGNIHGKTKYKDTILIEV